MLSFTLLPFTSILHTRKSTPIVALLSSSGVKLASVNLVRSELFPTLLLPMSNSLRLGGASRTVEDMRQRRSRWGGDATRFPELISNLADQPLCRLKSVYTSLVILRQQMPIHVQCLYALLPPSTIAHLPIRASAVSPCMVSLAPSSFALPRLSMRIHTASPPSGGLAVLHELCQER